MASISRIGASTMLDIDRLGGDTHAFGGTRSRRSGAGRSPATPSHQRGPPDCPGHPPGAAGRRGVPSCQPLHQSDEAAMADGEPILSLEAVLDHPTGEPLQDGHGADRGHQPGTKRLRPIRPASTPTGFGSTRLPQLAH
jgi:hypothetical protein